MKMKQIKKTLHLASCTLLLLLLLTSCNVRLERAGSKNSSPIASAVREVAGFERIQLMGATTVYYTQSDSFSVRVEAPEDLIEYVETVVNDSTLTIKMSDDAQNLVQQIVFFQDNGISVFVSSPDLVEVSLMGSGEFVSNEKIDTDNLLLSLRGSGNINLVDVICDHLVTSAVGSGDINIFNAEAQTSQIELVGSGDVGINHKNVGLTDILLKGSGDVKCTFNSCGEVKGDLRGSGDITLSGDVHAMNKTLLGSGDFHTEALNVQ